MEHLTTKEMIDKKYLKFRSILNKMGNQLEEEMKTQIPENIKDVLNILLKNIREAESVIITRTPEEIAATNYND